MTGYRLAILVDPFPQYADIYAAHPGLEARSSDDQRHVLDTLPPGSHYPYRRFMPACGVDVCMLYPGAHKFNEAWASERGLDLAWDGPRVQVMAAVVLAQLAELAPDVVLIHSPRWLQDDFLAAIKPMVPSVRLVVGFEGGQIRPGSLRDLDLLLVCVPPQLQEAWRLGIAAELLYHTFDPDVLEAIPPLPADRERYDAVFTGASGYGMGALHAPRYWALVDLMLHTPLQAWLQELPLYDRELLPPAGWQEQESAKARALLATLSPGQACEVLRERYSGPDGMPLLPLAQLFPERCHPAVYGLDMFDILRRGRVVFNMHTTFAQGFVGNARLFEATGVGACLLTDDGANLSDLFEAGREVAVYRTAGEIPHMVRWLLDHEPERQAIAAAGQTRTLTRYSFAQRCAAIDAAIRRRL